MKTPFSDVLRVDDRFGPEAGFILEQRSNLILKRLIWIYFWLVIFEGAIRKWFLPGLSGPLLIVRDPLVLLIYGYALWSGRFPVNGFVFVGTMLGLTTLVVGLIQVVFFGMGKINICLFGWRCHFLHFPLILVMGHVLTKEDLKSFGRAFLLVSIPMSILMVFQFYSPEGSLLNQGTESGTSQISAAMGKVRPPGTFAAITGIIYFLPLVAAFIFANELQKGLFSHGLGYASLGAVLVGLGISSSRSTLANILFVVMMMPLCWFFQPSTLGKSLRLLIGGTVVGTAFIFSPLGKSGLEVFTARIVNALEFEGGITGFMGRFLNDFLEPIMAIPDMPFWGNGLGMGTAVAAVILTGERDFLLAEAEYGRILLESGPLLGGAFLLFRISIAIWLGKLSLNALRQGQVLPVFLFAACALNIIFGQWAQTTILGLGVFGAGLCLAACRIPSVATGLNDSTSTTPATGSQFTPKGNLIRG
jgi:hypothetical protein